MRRWINISYKYVKKFNDIVKENLQKNKMAKSEKEAVFMEEKEHTINDKIKNECPHCLSAKKETKEKQTVFRGEPENKTAQVETAECPHCTAKKEDNQACGCEERQSGKSDMDFNQTAEKKCCCSQEKLKSETCCHGKDGDGLGIKNEKKESCPHCAAKNVKENNTFQKSAPSYGCCSVPPTETGCGCGAAKKSNSAKKEIITQCVLLSVSLVFLIAGFFDWKHIWIGFYYFNPAWIALLICGVPIFISAVKLLSKGKIKANTLISIAMLACVALEIAGFFVDTESGLSHNHSYVFAAGEIAFLMSLGSFIEDLTVKKCRSGIEKVVNLLPKDAFVLVDGEWVNTPTDKIKAGDMILVKSGEVIAVDGIVKKGNASIDQSSVTGEYLPFEAGENSPVYGGTINLSGVIEIEATKAAEDTVVAKMAKLTLEAEGKKAPISRLADRWVTVIIPVVIVTSILVGIISAFGFKLSPIESLIRAITILVVFCPCAFALATPTAIAAGLGNGAMGGVLIKSGESLEELSKINVVCLDKTGTLTEGKIKLDKVFSLSGDVEGLIKTVASLERYSEHPLSLAVIEYYGKKDYFNTADIQTVAGEGIKGKVEGRFVEVTSYGAALKRDGGVQKVSEEFLEQGKTLSCVFIDSKLQGVLAFSDTIREDAVELIATLKARGYIPYMLTGDNEKSARFIADKCGIENVYSSLMPSDKLEIIEKLQKEGKKVCMLGDGINDAPALKLANVSFAMGAMGSDIAIDSADVAIMDNNVAKLSETLKLSKRVVGTIKRNIVIALAINITAVLLSLFGYLTPVTGALVHNGTSILVVASSALLLYRKKKEMNSKKNKVVSIADM